MVRKPILDTTLAKAVDQARAALLEITDESMIGEHLGAADLAHPLVDLAVGQAHPGDGDGLDLTRLDLRHGGHNGVYRKADLVA